MTDFEEDIEYFDEEEGGVVNGNSTKLNNSNQIQQNQNEKDLMATPINKINKNIYPTNYSYSITQKKTPTNTSSLLSITDLAKETVSIKEFFLLFFVIIVFQIDYIVTPIMKLLPLASRSFTLLTLTGVSVFRAFIICILFFILRVFI